MRLDSILYYQRIISLLSGSALIVGLSGKILATNQSAVTLFGGKALAERCLFDVLQPETHSDTKIFLRRCAQSTQTVVGTLRLSAQLSAQSQTCHGALLEPRSPDREPVIFLRLQPKNESNIKFLALQTKLEELNHQVSRRLKAERALLNQTKHLEVTLKSIGEGVIITDSQARITFVNPVAELVSGWHAEQAFGKPVSDIFIIVDEQTGEKLENPVVQALLQKKVITHNARTALVTKLGERVAIETTTAPIISDTVAEGVITVFHDVSEKRALEQQLSERAERLALMDERKNQFMAMLAHELRAPVAPISYAAQVMKLQTKTEPMTDKSLQVIERQVSHLKRLIDDMLDVSRITSGKMNIVKKEVDLVSLIESVCYDLSSQFQQSEISCFKKIPSHSVWIQADADRMTQVLQNVLYNALKFTPPGGAVTVTLLELEDSVNIGISDTGIGIEESAISDLFEPFTQAEQQLDRSTGGLGLGLSLVKGIVEMHGGSVSASSDGLNCGATIDITLPLGSRQSTTIFESAEATAPQTHRILLIEDDHDTAETMCQLLELKGHDVFWASDGPEGVEKADHLKPTLIFCDIGLPGLDGFAVVELLRNNVNTSSIPIVALSGYGDTRFVNRAKEVGFDLHITKPASLGDLQEALKLTRKPAN